MKRIQPYGSFLVLCLLLLTPPAEAADFSLFGGVFDDPVVGDDLFGVGVRLAFFDRLQVEIGAAYYSDFDSRLRIREGDDGVEVLSADLELVPVEAGLRYNFGEPRRGFYLGGGIGWYAVDLDGRGGFGGESGLYAAAGWQYEHLFLEAIYRDVNGEFDDELGRRGLRTTDLDLSGLGVQVGWRF